MLREVTNGCQVSGLSTKDVGIKENGRREFLRRTGVAVANTIPRIQPTNQEMFGGYPRKGR